MSMLSVAKKTIKKTLQIEDETWNRVAEVRATRKLITDLGPEQLTALEISGHRWHKANFKEYEYTTFLDEPSPHPKNFHTNFDICNGTLEKQFDLVIAEHVFEHLLYPYRACRNVYEMLKPGGYFLISTPFLVRIHSAFADCTRWTEQGLRHFLEESGFPMDDMVSGSWGNRACVKANFNHWVRHLGILQSMKNEPDYPVVVWALARKPAM